MKSNHGQFLILFLFLNVLIFTGVFFLVSLGQEVNSKMRLQTIADEILLSSLRVRAQGLEKIAERWSALQALMGDNSSEGVHVPSGNIPTLFSKLTELKNALPGYKGRIKSVAQVILQTQALPAEAKLVWDSALSDLGLQFQSHLVIDENNNSYLKPDFWIKRLWIPSERLAPNSGGGQVGLETPFNFGVLPLEKISLTLKAFSQGKIKWDVNKQNVQIQSKGNGGYPRNWGEAVDQNSVNPFRTATYLSQRENKNENEK